MDDSGAASDGGALPNLILYSRPGCHLCDDARAMLRAILDARAAGNRPVPRLIERDITTNETWARTFFTTIPVVEFGSRRVELATSVAKLRALLATADAATADAATADTPAVG